MPAYLANSCGDGFAACDNSEQAASFMNSDLWHMARRIMFLVGILTVIGGAVRFVSKLGSGKIGDSVKTGVAALAGAAFLFNPHWLFSLIQISSQIVGGVFDSVADGGEIPTPTTVPISTGGGVPTVPGS